MAQVASKSARILIVDDDPIVAESLGDFLQAEGYSTATAASAEEALSSLAAAEQQQVAPAGPSMIPFSLVVSDVAMPGIDGLELLRRIGKHHPGTAVVMLTGYGTIESAVQAVRLGAADYLTKPVVDDELRMALERALRQQALLAENKALKQQLDVRFGMDSIVGSDARMLKTYDLIAAVAPTKTTVLMTGESGTGKSLIAHAIHHRSPRKNKPFVELACGSIPETLLESELFGHVKGAFTGAHADKVGKFFAANGGSLFLDEINSASPGMQLKLLRVLQERRFEPVGSNQTVEVDVRVILASNQPLEDLVSRGLFRQDLYYRINVVKIELPPLRERVSDITMLAEHFLKVHGASLGKTMSGFDAAAMDLLRRYSYPGNVRELSNIVERAAVLSRSPTIRPEDLPSHVVSGAPIIGGFTAHPTGPLPAWAGLAAAPALGGEDDGPLSLESSMKEPERQIILGALKTTGWNKLKAAELLKINRTTLYKKMKRLNIDPAREARSG